MENKSLHAIYLAAIIALGVVYLIEVRTNEDGIRAKDAEFKSRLREKEELYRTLEERYILRGDSLETAHELIKFANFATEQSRRITKQTLHDHDTITFVRTTSDSVRNGKLAKLYPSYRLLR